MKHRCLILIQGDDDWIVFDEKPPLALRLRGRDGVLHEVYRSELTQKKGNTTYRAHMFLSPDDEETRDRAWTTLFRSFVQLHKDERGGVDYQTFAGNVDRAHLLEKYPATAIDLGREALDQIWHEEE